MIFTDFLKQVHGHKLHFAISHLPSHVLKE